MKLIKKTNSYILMTALTMAMAGSSATAQADDHLLKVSSSLMPIHLLTKQIGAGVVDASLILPANQSAHHAPFRPSQRRLITNSDVVFAIDPKMEGTLAKVMVQEADKFVLFSDFITASQRGLDDHEDHHDDHKGHDDHDEHEGHKDHDDHDHHDDHKGHDDHKDHDDHDHHDGHKGHDDHDDHKDHDDHDHHDDHKGHDDHDDHKDHDHDDHHDEHEGHKDHDDHDSHAGHDHSGPDYHFWFSPHKMVDIAEVIYQTLLARLPEQETQLADNYQQLLSALDEADMALNALFEEGQSYHFIAMHDNTLYLEESYPIEASGFILTHDHGRPSAGMLRDLQRHAKEDDVACVLTEPQVNDKLAREVATDLELQLVTLDPLGASLDENSQVSDYWALVVKSMKDCFTS